MEAVGNTLILQPDRKMLRLPEVFTGTPGRCWYSNTCPHHGHWVFENPQDNDCYMCKHPLEGICLMFNGSLVHMAWAYVNLLYLGSMPVNYEYNINTLRHELFNFMLANDELYLAQVQQLSYSIAADAHMSFVGKWTYDVSKRCFTYGGKF